MKKFLFLLFVMFFSMVSYANAENKECIYEITDEEAREYVDIDGHVTEFSVVINTDKKENEKSLKCSNENSETSYCGKLGYGEVFLYNLDSVNKNYLPTSAIDYYKAYGSCPEYFDWDPSPQGGNTTGGFFSTHDKSFGGFGYIFKLKSLEYDDELNKKEELYSCTLYSSNIKYEYIGGISIRINYTKKEITTSGNMSNEEKEKFLSKFDWEKKNVCPVNKIKLCAIDDLNYLYDVDSEGLKGDNCTILDRSEKLEIGDTYCGIFKSVFTTSKVSDSKKVKEEIKNFCSVVLPNADYKEDKYSCIHMCLEMNEYFEYLDKTPETLCGFSDRLLVIINNILRWIKYILPAIVIILGIIDFMKAIGSDKEDEMKKAQKKFIIRLISAALVYIVPLIITFILDKMGFTANSCGIDLFK